MTPEQSSEIISQLREDVAGLRESLKSAHRRIDENDALTNQIHKLASNIETLTQQMKSQNERQEKMFETFEKRMKAQGERIGELEAKPAKRWDAVTEKVIMCVITAVAAFFLARIGL